jgi:predicted Fe-S protein YdhL (DUF1289 family)
MAIQSPCVKICVLDPVSGLCLGCGRTGEEIGRWIGYTDDERSAIMAAVQDRLAGLTTRKGRLERIRPSEARRDRLAARLSEQ